MSESLKEHIFWISTLLLLPLSLWVIYNVAKSESGFQFNEPIFLLAMGTSIPLTMILDLLLYLAISGSSSLTFWTVRPAVSSRWTASLNIESCFEETKRRLVECGFNIQQPDNSDAGISVRFSKTKARLVMAFLDSAISGTLTLRSMASGTELATNIVHEDTLIIDSGERAHLRALAAYLCLECDSADLRRLPLTLYCGLTMAAATVGLGVVARPLGLGSYWLFSVAASAAGMIGLTAILMLK
ncbi:MAG TPA: hypothetical protein VJX67_10295, partial [Blastocatellia bacterium]|nr:hypothetical protein [Blastocatellia bacterium]